MTKGRRHRAERGFTLIEMLVVVSLAVFLTGGVVMGLGAATNAKLKASATLVSSAVRSAFTRASATAKPIRVVLDIDESRVWLEEGSQKMLVNEQDPSRAGGGADPATEAERLAAEEASKIMKGPKAPKSSFKIIQQPGFESDTKAGRELGRGVRFREVHVQHQLEPAREGRAYLYVWPGGQSEPCYVQLGKFAKGETPADADLMTLTVHPLTGRVKIMQGAFTIPMGTGEEASEREDRNF